ncbi:MAG: CDP-alcohol phosphatidyltransferase family protein [Proteobacteria bacterium]|jgi:CDP-diacylglycerol--glycerol-3-phosphate 3-phosphatidyltransferase|nr:CDP-alcohol phosphatidyltransferase family protein [Pseudomonadota bacterium]NBX45870.1 CDP-alcohol phosphatidyltransferase family protein [Chloroflexota bacterium]NBQ31353.1 CDP-alcohol phosphatidyltransferase family protein [Pseudomonadota bacterium]NBQ60982.1 CDP-alcohol phosphatidyltransferase family protein [Pseudomonadota bacterium]NBT02651.1 CDP-alcohol phosphatidyltransferase family protein [Pseudomonadota bacterium]
MAYSDAVATFRTTIQLQTRRFAEWAIAPVARTGITPNGLTVFGLLLNIGAGVVLASGEWFPGGVLVLVAGAFDMFDGALARVMNQKTAFGAFLDSTLDRYSEVAVLVGLQLAFLRAAESDLTMWVGVTLSMVILANSLMTSYARARAEGLGLDCEVGLFQRPERVIGLGAALLLPYNAMIVVLTLVALGTLVTVYQRVLHVWRLTASERAQ